MKIGVGEPALVFSAPDSTFFPADFFEAPPPFSAGGSSTGSRVFTRANQSARQRRRKGYRRKKEKEYIQKAFGNERCYWISTAFSPDSSSHLSMITSTYRGSSSMTYASLPFCSHAMIVVPLPPKRSRTAPPDSVLLRIR